MCIYFLQGYWFTSSENRKKKSFHPRAWKRVCVNMTSLWLTVQRLNAKHSSLFKWKLRAWNCCQTHCWTFTFTKEKRLALLSKMVEKWKSSRYWISQLFPLLDSASLQHSVQLNIKFHKIKPHYWTKASLDLKSRPFLLKSLDLTIKEIVPCFSLFSNRPSTKNREKRAREKPADKVGATST